MGKKRFVIEVIRRFTIELDTTKFNGDLMSDFNSCISDFGTDEDAYEQHALHIARLASDGFEFNPSDFVEGYGPVAAAGITVAAHNQFVTDVIEAGES